MKLTHKAEKEMEQLFALRREAIKLLDLVVAEWNSDPQSTQCFDLRIVQRSKEVIARLRAVEHDFSNFPDRKRSRPF